VVHDQPAPDRDQHPAQVLRFRARSPAGGGPSAGAGSEPHGADNNLDDDLPDYLAPYQQEPAEDEHINYRHRMMMNLIAVAVIVLLIGSGVWIADTIAAMERDEDCVMQGRQNCAPVDIPVRSDQQ
jgi:hypothetical protein